MASGDYTQALSVRYEELMAIRERHNDPGSRDGPETLDVINNFGNLQYLLNNYNEAVALDI